ncbi:Fe2+-dependent dioxygenase [Pollutimonas harenae]|uniref:Fe2+-dependent dioxygenase n=1 Tax=Pollutimonas harenae TaxID=657015 RepID=A0A853GXV3_9BURK|nr:Fe2+-dependent dioxygenase [Pollutimonas harenae]NYT86967.1 Fe2+-dependent dioxygenase [Pollutimonas harenae]TEA69268.1 Fe2+-dependent dioxygenase [Pollutimonas harenae]
MLLSIPDIISTEAARQIVDRLETADWKDGKGTAGHLAVRQKRNAQLDIADPLAQQIGNLILSQLSQHPTFISATLPLRILPPMLNRYAENETYGDHIDNAIRTIPGTQEYVRTDISATLFLADPQDYEGGELIINDTYGQQSVKLPAGHIIVYPGTSLHRVNPVSKGVRYAAFFWVQSMIRNDTQRALLYELDSSIQALTAENANASELIRLSGVYHNLVRQWANT